MNFLTRLAVAALALAFMAIAPARAQTVPYGNLSQSTWVSIGTGPLAVTLNTTAGIYWLSASSQPSASVIGNPIDLSQPVPQPVVIPGPGTIWVRAIQSGGASIQVTPAQGGATNPLSVAGAASSNYAPSQVSVAATATSLIAARSGGRNAVIITNMSTTPVFLGGSGVTAATGGYLAGIVGAAKVLPYNGAIYGITATGTASVSVEEIY